MSSITTIFFDVGGVILTDAWDHNYRLAAAEEFKIDFDAFEKLHQSVAVEFETGKIDLTDYVEQTVFNKERTFTRGDFLAFMLSQSRELPGSRKLLDLVQLEPVRLYTLNNESMGLNLYRIEKFGLKKYFSAFFSSCFLGIKKPDPAIYRMALEVSQSLPEEALFIDDREPNLAPARQLGMQTILCQNPNQLRGELAKLGLLKQTTGSEA